MENGGSVRRREGRGNTRRGEWERKVQQGSTQIFVKTLTGKTATLEVLEDAREREGVAVTEGEGEREKVAVGIPVGWAWCLRNERVFERVDGVPEGERVTVRVGEGVSNVA